MTHCARRSFRSLLRDPDMLHGPILPSLAAFSVPIFLSMLFQNLYNTVDGIIVGRFLGEAALAAVGAGGVVLNLLIGFANGVGTGMSMAIARRYGAGDAAGVKRTAAACLVIGLAITLTLTVLGLVFLEDLLRLLNTPEEIFGEAERYIRIVVANIAVCFLYNVFCGMLKALGNSVMPLVYLIISSGLNILLDLLLVVALKRGVSGAAEATVIAQAVSALCSGWYIFRRMPALVPERAHFRFDRALYGDIAWAGVSVGLMNSIVMIGTLTLQYGINSLGTLTIAAHTAARKAFFFGGLPVQTLGAAVSMFISQNQGAGQYSRMRRAMGGCYLFNCCYAVVITVVFWLIARPTMVFLTGSDHAEVIENGVRFMRFTAPFYMVLGTLAQTRFALQGMGRKLMPMISSAIELVGKVIFTAALVPVFGYDAVIVCEPVIWCVMAAQLVISLFLQPELRKGKQNRCQAGT